MGLRVGIVDYLNSRPLAWGFLTGRMPAELEASYHPPARVADLLAAGEIDVGLVPSIEVQRIPGLEVLPGMGVCASHEVRSVLLVSRCEPGEIRRLALDRNSRTSAALVRILLADVWGVDPAVVTVPADLESMLADADAALIIGDPALRVDRSAYRVLDLAAGWRGLTGHPFVFAVWAVRAGVETAELGELFHRSLALGLAEIDRIVTEAAAELDLPRGEMREYLTSNLGYRLGEDELQGLLEYYRRAASHGLLEEVRPLRLRRETRRSPSHEG
ncbi:MAG: menaquinone biosynthesis protein [Thermoanaerobaculia bacterium]